MGGVVAAVPGIEGDGLVERDFFIVLGVEIFAGPIGGGERVKEGEPALVESIEKRERWGDGGF